MYLFCKNRFLFFTIFISLHSWYVLSLFKIDVYKRQDETRLEGMTRINDHEFEFHNAHCFKIDVPQIGSAQAIYYDVAALKVCCEHIKKNHISHPIVYIMACRIGPFARHFYKEIHKLGGCLLYTSTLEIVHKGGQ